ALAGVTGVAAGVLAALALNYVMMAQLGLRLAALPPASFLAAHLRAVPFAALTLGATLGAKAIARSMGLHDWSALALAVVLASGAALCALLTWPRLFLGADAPWLAQVVGRFLPSNIVQRFEGAKAR